MQQIKFIILIFLILLVALSCSTNKSPLVKPNEELVSKITLPWYVANTPENTSLYIYGVGNGKSLEEATISAKESIVSYYKFYVENEFNSYIESNQINDSEYYRELISHQISLLSNLNIPGISITEVDQLAGTFYALASLEREIFDKSQNAINQDILTAIELGDKQIDPGLKLQSYNLATSFLSKLIEPIKYKEKLVFIYLSDKINSIFANLEIDYKFSEHSQYSDYSGLIINIRSIDGILTGIPLLIGDNTYYPDKLGNYYLENISQEPFDLLVKVDVDAIKLSSDLVKREITDAKKSIRLITPFEQNIHIIPPVDIKAFVKVSHYINNIPSENRQLVGQIKNYLLQQNISITPNQHESNMQIIATTYVNESSYNQYIGYAYKAEGDIKILGVNNETVIVNLLDEETKENTKSFGKQKARVARTATEKLNRLLSDKLEQIKLDD